MGVRLGKDDLAKIVPYLYVTIDAIELIVSDVFLLTKAIEEGKLGVRTVARICLWS